MTPKFTVTFQQAQQPITEPITKFGGQPVWLTDPQWPISRATDEPMRFIGQIALDPAIFGTIAGQMAYLFISDGETFVDNTFDPEGGENAIIIQPGTYALPTQPLATGPTLYQMLPSDSNTMLAAVDCEFAVDLTPGEDYDQNNPDSPGNSIDDDEVELANAMTEVKIGGMPIFLQGPEFPLGGNGHLLLQLDSAIVPFYINFGDTGVGYAFLSADGTSGRLLWQCA